MKNKIIKAATVIGIILAILPSMAFAAGTDIPMLDNIIDTAFTIAGACIVVGLVIVGAMFLTSTGNEERLGKAKKGLVWLVIGTIIYFGVQVIRSSISQIIGL